MKNLIDFVQKLTIKRLGKNNQDAEDIAQEVFINLHLEGITEPRGNELRINHLIQYHINKVNRTSRKFIQVDDNESFDSLLDIETSICNSSMIESFFKDFRKDSKIRESDLELCYNVKLLNIPYSELCAETGTNRKRVNRVYSKFKKWLECKGITLDSFYE